MGGWGSANRETMKMNVDTKNFFSLPSDQVICTQIENRKDDEESIKTGIWDKINSDLPEDLNSKPLWPSLEELMFERQRDEDYYLYA